MATVTAQFDIVRDFAAAPERVFRAWTEPESFAAWFGPRTFTMPIEGVVLDTRPGGGWQATMTSGDGFEVTLEGTYREVEAPHRLVFTTGDPDNPGDNPASVVTVEFTGTDGGTRMSFHQAGVNTDEEHAEGARTGWLEFFDRLAEHLAKP